jgi:hypothetical protein
VAWSPPLASLTPPALILATSSSNSLPHLAAAAFWWMGIGRMVGWGGRQRRELLIDRGTTRSKGGLNHHKNPLARSDQAGRPRPSGSVWARLSPRGSSWHFALGPLHLCHFEVVIPAIKVGGLLVWSSNFTSSPQGWSVIPPWSLPPLEVISPCTRTRKELLICSFELVVTPSLLSMFSRKNTTLPNARTKINLLYH